MSQPFSSAEHILAELRGKRRQPLGDRRQSRLGLSRGAGARAGEIEMIALEHARLLDRKPELVLVALSASMRLNKASFKWISLRWRASTGAISRSIAWSSSLVAAPARLKNTFATRSRLRPLRSSASIVLAKVGASGFAAMASISARWSFSASVERGPEMPGLDAVERRRLERPGPGLEKRVLVSVRLGHPCLRTAFANPAATSLSGSE